MSDVQQLLPELIEYEIFSRLPVKSLLRFRSVSKYYCALIDSPVFIKTQLLKCSDSNQNIIFWHPVNIYSATLSSLDKPILLNHPFVKYHTPNPFATPFEDMVILLGSCNGLICLRNNRPIPHIVFWNPSTRKHHDLPVSKFDLPVNPNNQRRTVVYGFGYDEVNDDYKVLRITQFYNEATNRVMIYSLKSDSWRSLDDCPFPITAQKGVFVDHSVHWIVREKSSLGIAYIFAFHLGTEKYHKVPLPQFSDKNFFVFMSKLGGKLCLNCIYDRSHIDLWSMNTYGVKESWTKLLSSPLPLFVHDSRFDFLAYSKDGNQMLWQSRSGRKLCWYDLQLRICKDACIPDIPWMCTAFLSVESLVKLPHAANTGLIVEDKRKSKKGFNFSLSYYLHVILAFVFKCIG